MASRVRRVFARIPNVPTARARLLLLDNVITTGATTSECARVLLEDGGATIVDACVLAQQPWRGLRSII